jgi:hypothetical protein
VDHRDQDHRNQPDDEEFAESDALIDEALDAGDPGSDAEVAPVRPVDKFRRSALGSVAAAGLLGLRDALEGRPEKEEPAIMVDAPAPKDDGPVAVTLDFEHPERSRAVIRRKPDPDPAPPSDSD